MARTLELPVTTEAIRELRVGDEVRIRGAIVTAAFPGCLAALGFLDARELRTLGRMLERVRAGRAGPAPAAAETDVTLADDQQIP